MIVVAHFQAVKSLLAGIAMELLSDWLMVSLSICVFYSYDLFLTFSVVSLQLHTEGKLSDLRQLRSNCTIYTSLAELGLN